MSSLYMKKVSNKYVNFGIAFALLGILVFSLIMSPLEGFKEAVDKETDKNPADKKLTEKKTKEIKKMIEDLVQMQHVEHVTK